MADPRIRPFLWGLIDRCLLCPYCWGSCRTFNQTRREAWQMGRRCHRAATEREQARGR